MPVLTVIDDEPFIRHAFTRAFRSPEYELRLLPTAQAGWEDVCRVSPDAVILDVHLPDGSGLELFERIRGRDARIPVILVTGHGTTDLAIEAIKRGAYEYLVKPLELSVLRELVRRACESSRLMHVPAVVADEEAAPERADLLLGRCPEMIDVYRAIGRAAPQDVSVLVCGETGTGKELVARAVYQHSRRANGPFLAINCAAIPEQLLESELFGHEKGAFTGADRLRVGKFEQCNGGTIFLDEVGEMASLTQAKILRLLQEQTFERVGGSEIVRTDVRLIAATNADLEALIQSGRFRRDLYFRLNVFRINLPPLRERGGDLRLLVEHYVRRFASEITRPLDAIAEETMAALQAYPWPGNVRELQSVLKQGLLRMRGRVLLPDDLPESLGIALREGVSPAAADAPFDWDQFVSDRIAAGTTDLYAEARVQMEQEVLARVLRHVDGSQFRAAKVLGITRGTLRDKLRSLGISVGRSVRLEKDPPD